MAGKIPTILAPGDVLKVGKETVTITKTESGRMYVLITDGVEVVRLKKAPRPATHHRKNRR